MDPDASAGNPRRGFFRRRRLLLLAVPPLLAAAGLAMLGSQWMRDRLAAKIERRTGLETRVGSITWTPWNGLRAGDIEILQPLPLREAVNEPLVRVTSARVTPVWRAWLRGRPELRSIALENPRIVLPLELLAHLGGQAPVPPPQPPIAAPPPVAAAPTTPPVTAAPTAPTAPAVVVPPAAAPPQPTGWLRLENASFVLVHAGSGSTLLELAEISGAIPVSGDAAESKVRLGTVSLFGAQVADAITTRFDWKAPLLSLKPLQINAGSFRVTLAAKAATFSGLPLQIEAQVPRQPLGALALPLDGEVAAESLALNARFRGLLFAPPTWQGDLLGDVVAPSLRMAGHEAKFDNGSAVTVLRGGIVSCTDARLIGDGLSLLGNATVLADGRAAAAIRLVAEPATAASIAARVLPDVTGGRPLTPLSTPQRAAFDLQASGRIGHLFLRLGTGGPVVSLKPSSAPPP